MSEHVRMKNFVILAAFAAVLLAGCGENSPGGFQGYIEGEYVYVAAPLGGALTNLAVARGDSVKSGQLLFELERQSEAAALAQAGKNLAQAQAQLDDLTKGRRPTEIDSLAAHLERAQARAQNDANQAQVSQLAADLATAKLGGRDDAIRAAQAAVESQRAALDKAKWSLDRKSTRLNSSHRWIS